MRLCSSCKVSKNETEFNKKRNQCRECRNSKNRTYYEQTKQAHLVRRRLYREKLKAFLIQEKSKPCADCGVQYPAYIMDFDHLDASTKVDAIGTMVSRTLGLDAIRAEIAKCELVCANCHRARTWQRAQKDGVDSLEGLV